VLFAGFRCVAGRAHASLLTRESPFPAEPSQSTFGDFHFVELVAELCLFRIELHEPLGNALLLQPDLVQYSHYTYP